AKRRLRVFATRCAAKFPWRTSSRTRHSTRPPCLPTSGRSSRASRFPAESCASMSCPAPPSARSRSTCCHRSLRQALPPRLERKRNNQQANRKRGARPRDRHPQRSHAQHERTQREVHAGAEEAAHRRRERKRRRPDARVVLLRQPETEHGEVSA